MFKNINCVQFSISLKGLTFIASHKRKSDSVLRSTHMVRLQKFVYQNSYFAITLYFTCLSNFVHLYSEYSKRVKSKYLDFQTSNHTARQLHVVMMAMKLYHIITMLCSCTLLYFTSIYSYIYYLVRISVIKSLQTLNLKIKYFTN